MQCTITFDDPVDIYPHDIGSGCFAYESKDFNSTLNAGSSNAGEIVIWGEVPLTTVNDLCAWFWFDDFDFYIRNGYVYLTYAGPDGKNGWVRGISGPRNAIVFYDNPPDPAVGSAGDWLFGIETNLSGTSVFLVGADMPFPTA